MLQVVHSNITALAVDAIVNAANTSLLGGGGVDGAIHRAAGPQLLQACRKLRGCKVGQAKLTPGFLLPAAHVIHTVGPVWRDGKSGEVELLARCYQASLALVFEHGFKSVAFPCISTGSYRFPAQQAAEIAVATVKEQLADAVVEVTFCCFSAADAQIYQALL